jgi:hypothetical protein
MAPSLRLACVIVAIILAVVAAVLGLLGPPSAAPPRPYLYTLLAASLAFFEASELVATVGG